MKICNCCYLLMVNIISSIISYLGIIVLSESKYASLQSMRISPELAICLIVYSIAFIVASIFIKINKKELLLNLAFIFAFKLLLLLVAMYYEDSVFFYVELFLDTITLYLAEFIGEHLQISQFLNSILVLILSSIYCSGIFFAFGKLFRTNKNQSGNGSLC